MSCVTNKCVTRARRVRPPMHTLLALEGAGAWFFFRNSRPLTSNTPSRSPSRSCPTRRTRVVKSAIPTYESLVTEVGVETTRAAGVPSDDLKSKT